MDFLPPALLSMELHLQDERGKIVPSVPLIIFTNITFHSSSFFPPVNLFYFLFGSHSDPAIDFSDMKICNCVLINENKWLLWTNTSEKSASLIDMTVSMSLIFFFILCFLFFFVRRAHARAIPPTPFFVCVRARAEMRPVCLLLSQIAPMRDPKITTKGPQWVGWKPCHQPFQRRESPPLLYLWVTSHTSHGDRKGRQSHIFDRNKYFSVLTGLFWPFFSFYPPPPNRSSFVFLGGGEGRRGSDRGLSGLVTYPWQRKDQKVGSSWTIMDTMQFKQERIQHLEETEWAHFLCPQKVPMRGVIPLSCMYPRRAKRRLARDASNQGQGLLFPLALRSLAKLS